MARLAGFHGAGERLFRAQSGLRRGGVICVWPLGWGGFGDQKVSRMVKLTIFARNLITPAVVIVALNACAPAAVAPTPAAAPSAPSGQMQDVERPDVFGVTDRGLWDGRPSLGGVWVAHPDVVDPERVIVRNTANGKSVIAALFRRERANPGPVLQVSSDAAAALGMLAGSPAPLQVTALRRVEAPAPAAAAAPVVAATAPAAAAPRPTPAPTPAPAQPAPAPAAAAGFMVQVGTFASQASADTAIAKLRAAGIAADARAQRVSGRDRFIVTAGPVADQAGLDKIRELGFDNASRLAEPQAPNAVPPAAPAAAGGLTAQVGVFSVQNNADAAAARLRTAGFSPTVTARTSGGRQTWMVTATGLDGQAALGRIKALGFADAFIRRN